MVFNASYFFKYTTALAGVAQWVERRPENQNVTDAIPGQVSCRPGPQLGVFKKQLINVSLTHQCFSPSPLSKNKQKVLKKIQHTYHV